MAQRLWSTIVKVSTQTAVVGGKGQRRTTVYVFKESDANGVYEDEGVRDPSVLSCNKSSHIEARGE